MSIHPAKLVRGLVCLLALSVAPVAMAQTRIPTENTLEDLQLFAPADTVNYGDKPYLKEGLFLMHDFLFWSVQRPDAAEIGVPGGVRTVFDEDRFVPITERNSLDTGEMVDLLHTGNRTQVGWVVDCGGLVLDYFSLHEHSQRIAHNNAAIIFNDPQGVFGTGFIPNTRNDGFDFDFDGDRVYGRDGEDLGFDNGPSVLAQLQAHPVPDDPGGTGNPQPLTIRPVGRPPHPTGSLDPRFTLPYDREPDSFPNGDVPDFGDLAPLPSDFDHVVYRNQTDVWGLELSALRRLQRISYGGFWELFAGVRFVRFDEEFYLEGTGPLSEFGDMSILNEADNNMIGPGFGARWFKQCCRWTFAANAKFAPTVNFQAVRMRSTISSHNRSVLFFSGQDDNAQIQNQNAGNDSFHAYEFSPIGELRLNLSYQLTRAIAVRGGWSGMYIGGLARPSNMIIYELPNSHILKSNNYDDAFMQGINVGIEINR